MTLRDVAVEMRRLVDELDSAAARDVAAMLATRLLGRLDVDRREVDGRPQ